MFKKNVKELLGTILSAHRSTLFYHDNYSNRKVYFLNSDQYNDIYWDLYIGARHDACSAQARLISLANQDDVLACLTLALVYRDHKHENNNVEAIRWLNRILEIEQSTPVNKQLYTIRAQYLLSDLCNESKNFACTMI